MENNTFADDRLSKRDVLRAVVVGLVSAVVYSIFLPSGLDPSVWSEMAVAAGIRPPATIFGGPWNTLEYSNIPLFQDLGPNPYVYFVHSYHPTICAHTVAVTDHIVPFSSALQKDNFYALQFHPEKSGEVGARILHRFITMRHD